MKKINIAKNKGILIGVVLAVIGLSAFFIGFSVSNKQTLSQKPAETCEVERCIALTGSGANPDEVSVKIGSTIQFNSADGNSHSLSLGAGGEKHSHNGPFNSGEFKADEAWRATFDEPGTFLFHDHDNPDINVLVVAYGDNPKLE